MIYYDKDQSISISVIISEINIHVDKYQDSGCIITRNHTEKHQNVSKSYMMIDRHPHIVPVPLEAY